MGVMARVLGGAVVLTLCSGCGLAWIFEPTPPAPPVRTPEPASSSALPVPSPTPTPSEPEEGAYTGKLGKGAACVKLNQNLLRELEGAGAVGGAVTYTRGAMVKANDDWWAAAVSTQVNPNSSGYTSGNVEPYAYFLINSPEGQKPDGISGLYTAKAAADDAALKKAHECMKAVPVPKPTPTPGDPVTYTGKLAKGATCKAVDAATLAKLQDVGQVGGAVTYPRGRMVRANEKWWTVAVATEVHPNSAGLTAENVPPTALFVTNDPSYKESSNARIVYFPLNPGKKDTAAAKALSCLKSAG